MQKQMRAFLGLASYYRQFILHFAEVTAPLMVLLKGRGNWQLKWSEEKVEDFRKTQQALCKELVLHIPDFNCPFVLQTDASNKAIGTVLTQEMNSMERPIAYASRKLQPQEQRYATIERECLVIKWGMAYFHYYLLGHKLKLITDYAPLKWLQTTQTDNAWITLWALTLQPFHFYLNLGRAMPLWWLTSSPIVTQTKAPH